MALRDNKGKPEMLRLEVSDGAIERICASVTNIRGGVRGINALVKRACIFAAISKSNQILASHVNSAMIEEFRLVDKVEKPTATESPGSDSLRETIISRLQLAGLNNNWSWRDFAEACKAKSFETQMDYDKWTDKLAEIAGLDQGREKERESFRAAIKYDGENMESWLGGIRREIRQRSEGILRGSNRYRRRSA